MCECFSLIFSVDQDVPVTLELGECIAREICFSDEQIVSVLKIKMTVTRLNNVLCVKISITAAFPVLFAAEKQLFELWRVNKLFLITLIKG